MPSPPNGRREPTRLRLARLVCGPMQPFGSGKVRGRLYPYEHARRDAYAFARTSKTGSTFRGNTGDFHAYPFAVSGYGEWRNWAVALAICAAGDTIVEVGANVGTETIGYSDIVGGSGRVIAFEPLPANLEALESLTPGLRHPNVTVLPYALSHRRGTDTFAVPPPDMSQGIGHLLGPGERSTSTATYYDESVEMAVTEVECRTLDAFADRIEGVRLIVADAEGAEISILKGAERVLKAARPVLVLEASQPHQRRAGHGLDELYAEITRLGYAPFVIGALDVAALADPKDAPLHSNWLCLPNDHLLQRVRRSLRRCALTPCVAGLNPLTKPSRAS